MKFISQQDTLLNELDDATHRMTLEALESENAKLLLNPKTILASAGSYRTTTSTLHELTMDTNIYDGDNDDSDFWNSIMTDYTSLVHKIPQLLIKKIRGGIPSGLRPKIWMIMCDAQPERMKLLYPNLLKEESQFERIIKRDLPRTFPKVEMVCYFQLSSLKILKAMGKSSYTICLRPIASTTPTSVIAKDFRLSLALF